MFMSDAQRAKTKQLEDAANQMWGDPGWNWPGWNPNTDNPYVVEDNINPDRGFAAFKRQNPTPQWLPTAPVGTPSHTVPTPYRTGVQSADLFGDGAQMGWTPTRTFQDLSAEPEEALLRVTRSGNRLLPSDGTPGVSYSTPDWLPSTRVPGQSQPMPTRVTRVSPMQYAQPAETDVFDPSYGALDPSDFMLPQDSGDMPPAAPNWGGIKRFPVAQPVPVLPDDANVGMVPQAAPQYSTEGMNDLGMLTDPAILNAMKQNFMTDLGMYNQEMKNRTKQLQDDNTRGWVRDLNARVLAPLAAGKIGFGANKGMDQFREGLMKELQTEKEQKLAAANDTLLHMKSIAGMMEQMDPNALKQKAKQLELDNKTKQANINWLNWQTRDKKTEGQIDHWGNMDANNEEKTRLAGVHWNNMDDVARAKVKIDKQKIDGYFQKIANDFQLGSQKGDLDEKKYQMQMQRLGYLKTWWEQQGAATLINARAKDRDVDNDAALANQKMLMQFEAKMQELESKAKLAAAKVKVDKDGNVVPLTAGWFRQQFDPSAKDDDEDSDVDAGTWFQSSGQKPSSPAYSNEQIMAELKRRAAKRGR